MGVIVPHIEQLKPHTALLLAHMDQLKPHLPVILQCVVRPAPCSRRRYVDPLCENIDALAPQMPALLANVRCALRHR